LDIDQAAYESNKDRSQLAHNPSFFLSVSKASLPGLAGHTSTIDAIAAAKKADRMNNHKRIILRA